MPFVNLNWNELTLENISTGPLLSLLDQAVEPVSLAALTLAFIKDRLKHKLRPQVYNPNQSYNPGDLLILSGGRTARLDKVTSGSNPIQGDFQILAFVEADLPRLVAGLAKEPLPPAPPSEDPLILTEIEDQAREILRGDSGPYLQRLVQQALQADERCVGFVDEWWLVEKLPYVVNNDEVAIIRQLLQEQGSINSGELQPTPTEALLGLLWNISPEDQEQRRLALFSLNCALSQQKDFCYLRVGGWISTQQLPDYQIKRQPPVPRIPSQVWTEVIQAEADQEIRELLEEAEQATKSSQFAAGLDPWQDLEAWRRTKAWPEAKVKLLGQHYIQGFLPFSKKGLRQVIPPSSNPIEVIWFIFSNSSNNESRFQAVVNYQQGIVVGGLPLQEYLSSQGILPGCYLYVHRRNDVEYDIYPKLLPEPAQVECKFAWVDEKGKLVIETDLVELQYEHDPQYVISETRLENLEALWREATDLGLSFFDILIKHIFPELAPQGEAVHWRKLWETTFYRYRMGSPRTIQRELQRQCFVQMGDGYYQFKPERGYAFPSRDKNKVTPPPPPPRPPAPVGTIDTKPEEIPPEPPIPVPPPSPPTESPETKVKHEVKQTPETPLVSPPAPPQPEEPELATIEAKYLIPGPSPLGRILNYIRYIQEEEYDTVQRGPRGIGNLDQWTVYAMVGLGLVRRLEETSKVLRLTPTGEEIYTRLLAFDKFSDREDSATIDQIRKQIISRDETLYHLLRKNFLVSPSLRLVLAYLRSLDLPISRKELYTRFVEFYPEMKLKTIEHRLPGLLQVAEFCQVISWNSQGRLTLTDEAIDSPYKLKVEAVASEETASSKLTSNSTSSNFEQARELTKLERDGDIVPTEAIPHPEIKPTSVKQPMAPGPAGPTGTGVKPDVPVLKRDEMQIKALFSKYYLQTRLPQHGEWTEDPRPVFETMRGLWQKAVQYGDTWNEAQTEEEFIKPMLERLGWAYIVQAKAKKGSQMTRPDYALFADATRRDEAYPYQGQDEAFYSRALAIGEAKYWGRALSQKDNSGRDTWKTQGNPSHQMVSYLVGTRVAWGILTNGQTWRLYSREVSSTASEFYEVDLRDIFDATSLPDEVEVGDEVLEAFKRFWLFFRRQAFVPDAQGKSFVQRVNEGSATYAREISEKLKELVFEEVMPQIAGGFVAYRYQQLGIQTETEESLKTIYQASLSLLYKLLFLLYAEARGLLPMTNPGYQEQSLTAMAQWAAERRDKALPLSTATHATLKYDALLALFHRIDQGDPSLGIPRYNGGLFNPASRDNQFLEQHKLSDRVVAYMIDILVRDAGQPVDYAYISVRNLGAIYEGLLENRLRVVEAAAGKVELVNDKGERKASGSYYTPDYIVEYIVQHTLEPILNEREAIFRTAMDRCADLRRQLQRNPDQARIRLLRNQLEEAEGQAREAFLSIKVLDPAMGSGHFLVNAVDYLTDGIIQRLQSYHADRPETPLEWNPIQKLIERVRADILAEMERQQIEVEPERLDDTALLTRLVMKRCIYGVDLNPMAVELAKLSLWLHSFTVGAPLSFLDHHLRWGNSLIGTDVRTVEQEIQMTKQGQFGLFAGPFAGLLDLTGMMIRVAEQADATLADVHQSAEIFDQFQKELTPYKQILDLWVSQYFGNKQAREFLTLFGEDVVPALQGNLKVADPYQAAIQQARELWQEKRFFHWDLEFPEVFVDLHQRDWAENPGFDAVIGNPPYIRSINLKIADESAWRYYSQIFETASQGEYDIYLCFTERGHNLLNDIGFLGYILPNKWLTARAGAKLREQLVQRKALSHLVDFGSFQVFEGVTTYTCLLFLAGQAQTTAKIDLLQDILEHGNPIFNDKTVWQSDNITTAELGTEAWYFAIGAEGNLLRRLDQLPKLEEIGSIFSGTGTRADSVFFLSLKGNRFYSRSLEKWVELEPEIMRPSLTGRDIDPYYYDDSNWLLFPYNPDQDFRLFTQLEMAKRFPKAWAYLNDPVNVEQLVGRERGAFKRRDDWYAFGRPQNHSLLGEPKLVLPDVAGQAEFACDLEGRYIIDTVYGIRIYPQVGWDLRALTAVLNSSILTFFLQQTGTDLRGGYFRMKTAYLNPFPVPKISFTTPPAERIKMVNKGKGLAEPIIVSHLPLVSSTYIGSYLKLFIQDCLSATPREQTDVVHDLLAHLAEQMMEINKEKQSYLSNFRLDLAGYLSEKELNKLNRLYTPKKLPQEGDKNYAQKLAAYQQAIKLAEAQLQRLASQTLDLEDFWQLNQSQWMWLLRQNLGDIANMNRLVAVYKKYQSQLAPLMRRLQRTYWLIDQIVYQLYSLTEEEINIVERRG